MIRSRQHLLNGFGILFAIAVVFTGSHAARAAGDGCAAESNLSAEQEVQLRGIGGTSGRADFSCQNVGSLSASQRSSNCIDNACSGGADIKCCKPGTGSPRPTPTTGGGTAGAGGGGGVGRLVLPDCVDSGNCTLDDIIQTGVNFANFLFGLSGAIFLAIFVYAGILYLTAGGNTGRVSEAKKKLVDATIGMVLVISAGVLVTFIYNAFLQSGSSGGGTADRCAAAHPTWSCQTLPAANLSTEIRNRGCQTGLCPGASNVVCCPPSSP